MRKQREKPGITAGLQQRPGHPHVTPEGEIVAGPDRNLWFASSYLFAGAIGLISPEGVVTTFDVPTSDSQPWGITVGPDGNLWFTEVSGNNIGVLMFR